MCHQESMTCVMDSWCHTYQFIMAWLWLNVRSITREEFSHELEEFHGILVLVVHEFNVLFSHIPLYSGGHLYLTCTIC